MSYIQSNQLILLPDDDVNFVEEDSGKIYSIPALGADRIYRLPPLNPSLHFTFVNSTTNATLGNIAIIDAWEVGNNIYGNVLNTPAAITNLDDTVDVEFLDASVKGDYVELYCDGTSWYAVGMSSVAGLGNA